MSFIYVDPGLVRYSLEEAEEAQKNAQIALEHGDFQSFHRYAIKMRREMSFPVFEAPIFKHEERELLKPLFRDNNVTKETFHKLCDLLWNLRQKVCVKLVLTWHPHGPGSL